MELDELNSLWAKDCKIDETNISGELRRIPEMHNKYFNLYMKAGLKVSRAKADLVELVKAKTEYYNGSMDPLEMKEKGWPPNPLKIIRQDINKYVESDKDIINLSLSIDYLSSIEKYLEDIVKQINNRNFILTNFIKWETFRSGGS